MVIGQRIHNLAASLVARTHTLVSGVERKLGGEDEGQDPHELLESALAGCTIITVQMYANRKGWPLESCDVRVKIESEGKEGTTISRKVAFRGALSAEQRTRLMEIANLCPIHKILTGSIALDDQMVETLPT